MVNKVFISTILLTSIFISRRDAIIKYGPLDYTSRPPSNGKYILKRFNFKQFGLPFARGYVNKDIHQSLMDVMIELKGLGIIGELKEFQGCYSPRFVSGTRRASVHAYGLGCDFGNIEYSEQFVQVWRRSGWTWGGTWCHNLYDPMHFSKGWENNNDCKKGKKV